MTLNLTKDPVGNYVSELSQWDENKCLGAALHIKCSCASTCLSGDSYISEPTVFSKAESYMQYTGNTEADEMSITQIDSS